MQSTTPLLTGSGKSHRSEILTGAHLQRFIPLEACIDTPLLSRVCPVDFRVGDTAGRIYAQYRTLSNKRHHPHGFYVEWPAGSEQFHEIHAPALADLTGLEAAPGYAYTPGDCARLIRLLADRAPETPVSTLLQSARPQA